MIWHFHRKIRFPCSTYPKLHFKTPCAIFRVKNWSLDPPRPYLLKMVQNPLFWGYHRRKKWFLAHFTSPNRSETIKNGFYVKNWVRGFIFRNFKSCIGGLGGVQNKSSGGGCRDDFWDFSSKKWFLAHFTSPNRSETIKSGFYVKNWGKGFIFRIFKTCSVDIGIF